MRVFRIIDLLLLFYKDSLRIIFRVYLDFLMQCANSRASGILRDFDQRFACVFAKTGSELDAAMAPKPGIALGDKVMTNHDHSDLKVLI